MGIVELSPAAPAPPPAAAGPDAPRVVFFGPPRSGRTTLYLLFAGRAGVRPRPTTDVCVATVGVPPRTYLVADTDGEAAKELLARPGAVAARRGSVADAVRSADALVVTVDATASFDEVSATFAAFADFLGGLRSGRTDGREVGGLPVFLTLTKCDALYRPGDTPDAWMHKVDVCKAVVEARFTDYFPDDAPADEPAPAEGDDEPAGPDPRYLRFGSLTVELMATAGHVPAGGGQFAEFADRGGTFGIDELAEAVLPAAADHRDRVIAARRQLRWTVAGSGGLLAVMAVVGGLLVGHGGWAGIDRLAERVRVYRAAEPPPSVRLADRQITRYLRELSAIRADDDFPALAADARQYVAGRLAEFAAYKEYRQKFAPPRLGPAEVRTRAEADALAEALKTELAPPDEYAAAWTETEAVKLRDKWRVDLKLMLEAEAELHAVARDLIRRANGLILTDTPPDFGWRTRVTRLLADAAPKVRPSDPVPGSPTVPVLRGRPLTYTAPLTFDRVVTAGRDWADTRSRLEGLRDITDAVGLSTGPNTPGPVLDLPEPAAGAVGAAELATGTLAGLRLAYPAKVPAETLAATHFPEWLRHTYPDVPRQAVEARLRSIRDTAGRHVRRLLRVRLGDGPETSAAWRALATDVLATPALEQWDTLLTLIDDLAERRPPGPPRPGPVAELRAYLLRDAVELDWPEVVITLPDDLLDKRAVPAGDFTVTVTPPGGPARVYAFRQAGEGVRDRPATRFSFRPAGHSGKLSVRPGDAVTATLPVRAGGQVYDVVWAGGRSAVFQLDRLQQPPRVESAGGGVLSPAAAGVVINVPPPGTWPRVPALLPDLRAR